MAENSIIPTDTRPVVLSALNLPDFSAIYDADVRVLNGHAPDDLAGRIVYVWAGPDPDDQLAAANAISELFSGNPIPSSVSIIREEAPEHGADVVAALAQSQIVEPPRKQVAKRALPPAIREEKTSGFVSWDTLRLAKSDRGPFPNEANARLILQNHEMYAGRVWLDEFAQKLMFDDRFMNETDMLEILDFIQTTLRIPKFPLQAVKRGAILAGARNARHPLKEYLESLRWDGIPRLRTLMADGWGAEQNDYTEAVGRCWIVSMVARVFDPGCQADYMPVFEGSQGAGKSSSLKILGGKWHYECGIDPIKKPTDFLLALQGKWLVEIPEMHAIGGREDGADKVKALITIRTDTYRVPYGATMMDYPRQCIFAGTTNRETWNPDQTGGRRFWPVRCGAISLEYLAEQRDQLFAEAVERYRRVAPQDSLQERIRKGADWWAVPIELAEAEQEERRESDVWEEVIEQFLNQTPRLNGFGSVERDQYGRIIFESLREPREEVSMPDVLQHCLDIPRERWRGAQKSVKQALVKLGFERKRATEADKNGARPWIYRRLPPVLRKKP